MVDNKRGAALGVVIISAIVFSILAYAMLAMSLNKSQLSGFEEARTRARYAAEAGLVQAYQKLWVSPAYCGETMLFDSDGNGTNETTVTITVTNCGGAEHKVSAKVTY